LNSVAGVMLNGAGTSGRAAAVVASERTAMMSTRLFGCGALAAACSLR
jgi:hypothetical protein